MGQALAKEETQRNARPFLKWAGGKSQLVKELLVRVPKSIDRYFEPMVGGGALFFSLRPERAFLSDTNPELINCYRVIRDDVQALIGNLSKHIYDKDYYYGIRNIDRRPEFANWNAVDRAARTIFLNKSCFNGLYRVNSKGQFNVPFGRYSNPKLLDQENLLLCSEALQGVDLSEGSFEERLAEASEGDFVYFDPPYAPRSETSNFTSYTEAGFGTDMQEKLRDTCLDLDKRGVKFMVSNSDTPIARELYQGFSVVTVEASRSINSKADGRGKINELIISNYSS